MPLESKAQGRFLNWKFGHDWVRKHHFGGSQEGLPQHVSAQRGTPNVGLYIFRQRIARNGALKNASRTGITT